MTSDEKWTAAATFAGIAGSAMLVGLAGVLALHWLVPPSKVDKPQVLVQTQPAPEPAPLPQPAAPVPPPKQLATINQYGQPFYFVRGNGNTKVDEGTKRLYGSWEDFQHPGVGIWTFRPNRMFELHRFSNDFVGRWSGGGEAIGRRVIGKMGISSMAEGSWNTYRSSYRFEINEQDGQLQMTVWEVDACIRPPRKELQATLRKVKERAPNNEALKLAWLPYFFKNRPFSETLLDPEGLALQAITAEALQKRTDWDNQGGGYLLALWLQGARFGLLRNLARDF